MLRGAAWRAPPRGCAAAGEGPHPAPSNGARCPPRWWVHAVAPGTQLAAAAARTHWPHAPAPRLRRSMNEPGGGYESRFSDAVATPTSRAALINSLLAWLQTHQLDGCAGRWAWGGGGFEAGGGCGDPSPAAAAAPRCWRARLRRSTESAPCLLPVPLPPCAASTSIGSTPAWRSAAGAPPIAPALRPSSRCGEGAAAGRPLLGPAGPRAQRLPGPQCYEGRPPALPSDVHAPLHPAGVQGGGGGQGQGIPAEHGHCGLRPQPHRCAAGALAGSSRLPRRCRAGCWLLAAGCWLLAAGCPGERPAVT